MRSFFFGAGLILTTFIAAAPAYAQVPTSWSGFYVGANAGAGWGESKFSSIDNAPLFSAFTIPPPPTSISIPASNGTVVATEGNDTDAIGGGQFGFNWQRGNVLYGAEADYDGSRIRSTGLAPAIPTGSASNLHSSLQSVDAEYFTKFDWLGSVRARIGFVQDYLLVYATGGIAFAHANVQTTFTAINSPAIVPAGARSVLSANDSGMHTGWTLGAGGEFKLSARWSIAAEYRYSDFGSQTYDAGIAHADFSSSPRLATKMRLTADQVTLRLNYRIGG